MAEIVTPCNPVSLTWYICVCGGIRRHSRAGSEGVNAYASHMAAAAGGISLNEPKAYNILSGLQVHTLSVLHSFGQMAHTGYPATVVPWAGCNMKS